MTMLAFVLFAAGALDSTFESGMEAYRAGDYETAIGSWERLADQGVRDAALFHNLGNAYFRSGELAEAIASYERALHLDSTLEGTRENLGLAIRQTERALPRPQPRGWDESLYFWDGAWSARTSFGIAGVLWFVAWAFLGARWFVRVPYLRRAAAACMVLCVVFLGSWWSKTHPPRLAVAAQQTVPVRYGVGENETVRFQLYEGDRVSVDAERDGWVRIQTAGGERGWTEGGRVLLVGPPYTGFDRETGLESGE